MSIPLRPQTARRQRHPANVAPIHPKRCATLIPSRPLLRTWSACDAKPVWKPLVKEGIGFDPPRGAGSIDWPGYLSSDDSRTAVKVPLGSVRRW